jgi:hypothetical protein
VFTFATLRQVDTLALGHDVIVRFESGPKKKLIAMASFSPGERAALRVGETAMMSKLRMLMSWVRRRLKSCQQPAGARDHRNAKPRARSNIHLFTGNNVFLIY